MRNAPQFFFGVSDGQLVYNSSNPYKRLKDRRELSSFTLWGDEMSYTGIAEIDTVLLDLYSELQHEPKDRALSERHRRFRVLADKLLRLGQIIHGNAGVAQESA